MINVLRFSRLNSVFILISLLAISGYAQDRGWESLSNYELPISIQKSLSAQFSDVKAIEDLALSITSKIDFTGFRHHYRYYLVNASIEDVWNKYLNLNLRTAWSGKATNFGFAYSRQSNELFIGDDDFILNPKEGLGLFLGLNVIKVFKIPVAFEVSHVDNMSKVIQFTYLKGNKANGRQSIIFERYSNNKTLILHQTYFKSEKKLRDRFYYTPFHTNFIDQFHGVVLNELATFKTVSKRRMKRKFEAYRLKLFNELKKLEPQRTNLFKIEE